MADRALLRVRGLRASMSASKIRLNAMAADRAPTIATTIQTIFAGTLTGLRGGGAGAVNEGGNLSNSIGHGFVPPPCG